MNDSNLLEKIKQQIEAFEADLSAKEVGRVVEVGDGIAKIAGLKNAMVSEMINFIDQQDRTVCQGVVLNLEENIVGAVVLGDTELVKEGYLVKQSGKLLSIPVSEKMIGRVVDSLGNPLDEKGEIPADKLMPIEKIAPGVITRSPVDAPVQTGIKAIDSMIPIGRGQRELIIGDRQTGKTAIAIDTIINQKGQNLICIYVAIGQKESKVAKIAAKLQEKGAMGHTVVVSAPASSPAAMQFIAPYAGTAIGEYFMERGQDALVVFDDLSKHAWAYREISLLLRRPPGREAYPGDIFYLHSRLLERAAKLSKEYGGGSLTALPIIETQAGDVSAYIPTNVISITDGQIYLESGLFYRGIRPAVNVGLSVSRVGSAAQIKAMKQVAGRLRLDLAQFRELEAFVQFASDLDPETKSRIERGKRLVEILKQPQYEPIPVEEQVALLYVAVNGLIDDIAVEKVGEFEIGFRQYLKNYQRQLLEKIASEKQITNEIESGIKSALSAYEQMLESK